MTGLRAIIVAVDYDDLLAVTLPYNRHHFDEVHLVTDSKSFPKIADYLYLDRVEIWTTDLFYSDGAKFNKWRALEWGLDRMGRTGWICSMDADVLWPREVKVDIFGQSLRFGMTDGRGDLILHRGQLMAPLRRMAPWPLHNSVGECFAVMSEKDWGMFPIHRNVNEWAGYTQVFHADDPVLGPAPWHEVDWTHAGGADSLFQRKWSPWNKVRPNWEVLHLGEPGINWYGRATPLADGSVPADSADKRRMIDQIWRGRSEKRRAGLPEAEQFRPEKLG
jgi:hypothetical protein